MQKAIAARRIMNQDKVKKEEAKQETESPEQTDNLKKTLRSQQEAFQRQIRVSIVVEEFMWE